MSKYIRTTILNFSELPKETQRLFLGGYEASDLHSDQFVKDPCGEGYLRLSEFMRADSKLWSGIFPQTAFSAYFIAIGNRAHSTATVAYRHN